MTLYGPKLISQCKDSWDYKSKGNRNFELFTESQR